MVLTLCRRGLTIPLHLSLLMRRSLLIPRARISLTNLLIDYIFLRLTFFYLGVLLASRPIIIRVILVLVSLIAALSIGALTNKWFIFILLLVFTGGIIIIVLYIANLAAGVKAHNSGFARSLFVVSLFSFYFLRASRNTPQIDSILKLFT